MAEFCKSEECPASDDLLAFQLGDIGPIDGGYIRRHLANCDFCTAEVEFYENYPPASENEAPPAAAPIPQPLFELAEAILTRRASDPLFDDLIEDDRY
ncbi:MAG: hypothetical protein IPM25_17880 [Chloracidobacterium sp.]|nr:hypothetical protein [Chloracidobacterium sp.]